MHMNRSPLIDQTHLAPRRLLRGLAAILLLAGAGTASAQLVSQTPLSSAGNVPGNLFLVPSVEFPTVISAANIQDSYATTDTYVGYFDSFKCYKYHYDAVDDTQRYFYPVSTNTTKTCTGSNKEWSGNFLNWAATQTIDPFRKALTGGYRSTDTSSLTLLEKARFPDSSEDYFDNRRTPTGSTNASLVQGAIGTSNWDHVNTRVARLGNRMFFAQSASNSSIGTWSPLPAYTDYDGTQALDGSQGNTLFSVSVRVKVCDNSIGLEPNCVQYGSSYKPEGLIQKYASRMRYSVTAYLNDSSITRDGGVLRARQKFVGPQRLNPTTGNWETNPNKEWDETTGLLIQNPDSTDATNTNTAVVAGGGAAPTINNSGVINYINKFGEMTNTLDKSIDPVSEMYYAALRYMRGKTNISAYSDLSGTAANRYIQADGFPVITNWDDPQQYYCQSNAFLGIGDVYTHRDKNLKGNTNNSEEPATPSEVNDADEPDALAWTNRVAQLEFSTNMALPFSGRNNSAYIAGLAYYAHTQDLRPDVTTDPLTKGMQTASTYWVDVREKEHLEPRTGNMYWLAAKYGGFTLPDPDNNNVFTTADYDSTASAATNRPKWQTSWWDSGESLGLSDSANSGLTNETYNRTSNYFTANQADKMYVSLASAFAKIANEKAGSGSSLASNSTKLDATTAVYQALFSNGNWLGQLKSLDLDNTTGQPNGVINWQAASVVPAQASRNIFINAGGTAKVWNSGNMTTTQKAVFKFTGMGAATTQDLIDWFRGDQINEESNPSSTKAVFRVRTPLANWSSRMGDVVDSTPIFVGAPNPNLYRSATFTGATGANSYALFAAAKAGRTQALWIGGNDGMLHAYDATTGVELYAFIPNQVIANGLAEYANPDYIHKYFVDGDMAVADVYDSGSTSWKTVLVGTLGRGGPGIFALDVTNPNSPVFLWEKGPSDFPLGSLGRNIGRPVIAQVADADWRVILGNGVDSTAGASLITIKLFGGAITETIAESTNGNGLSAVLARDNNNDGFAETAYAGDLEGHLFKFTNLTSSTATSTTMFTTQLNSPTTTTPFDHQRITAAPFAAKDPTTGTTWVFFGTGQYLNSADIGTTYRQTWYGIKDTGTAATFANLVQRTLTDTTTYVTGLQLRQLSTGTATDLVGKDGWYINLPISGERIVIPNRFSDGALLGVSLIPDSPDACLITGRGAIMYISPFTGGRLDVNFLDVNRDGTIDNGDSVGGSGGIGSGFVGTHSYNGSLDVGQFLGTASPDGTQPEFYKKNPPGGLAGRLSWREITN
jgi:type IV pilus assembly protein PilY1